MELVLNPVVNLGAMATPYTLANMTAFASAAASGQFPIAGNHYWHGGLHFKVPANHAVQAIARGKIVAYRINDDWKEYEPIPGSGIKEKYSTSFVLIEHDLQHDYAGGEQLFRNCVFYSLYMNLLPLADVRSRTRLPWFLCATRTDHATPVGKRGQAMPISQQANGMGKVSLGGADHWLPLKFFAQKLPAGSSADRYLTDPVGYSYATDPSVLNSTLQKDTVVTCSIPVEAGDLIGYPGGLQVNASTFADETFHFEVFFDNAKADFFDNVDASFRRAKNESIAGVVAATGKMGVGKFWLDTTAPATPPNPPTWQEHYNINVDQTPQPSPSPPIDEHYKFTPPMRTTPVSTAATLPIKTDLDWKDGQSPWKFIPGSDFLDTNGHVDHTKPALTAASTLRLAVKQHSEWSSTDLPGRFTALQNGESGLPKLPAAEFTAFVDHAKDHCFWESVSGLPAPTNVWHLNPIYFVDQLHRCLVPFHHVDGPTQQRFYLRCLNESLALLKQRKSELAATPLTPAAAARFKLWFGYDNTSNFVPSTTYTAQFQGSSYTPPHVATFIAAKTHIVDVIDKLIGALEESIRVSQVMRGFSGGKYDQLFAYVWGDDTTHRHIHLAGSFVGATPTSVPVINNSSNLSWDNDVNTFVHEISHFRDMGSLKDISIKDIAAGNEFGPYGDLECQAMAARYPSVALMNSDNFSFYIADGIHGTADSFNYLG